MRIDLAFGKANLSDTLATYGSMKVTAPFQRISAINAGKTVTGTRQRLPVGPRDLNGAIITDKVEHPEGTIVLLTASWKRRGMGLRDGAIFVRLREGAALWNIIAKVPTGPETRIGDEVSIFQGNADILRPDELKLYGIEVPKRYIIQFCDTEELAECFRLIKIAPERIARPSVALVRTETGVQTREIAAAPVRRLRMSRRL